MAGDQGAAEGGGAVSVESKIVDALAPFGDPVEKSKLGRRIKDLSILYRETQETARLLEHYYDGRCGHGGK